MKAPGAARWRRLEAPALAALGALQTLAFVHTALWVLPLLAIPVLVWPLPATSRCRRAPLLGWFFGFASAARGTRGDIARPPDGE